MMNDKLKKNIKYLPCFNISGKTMNDTLAPRTYAISTFDCLPSGAIFILF